jgi:neutral amino acid transport system permease protein
MLAFVLGSVIVAVGLGATSAWAQDEGVQGRLTHEGDPVAGVTINVYTEDGDLVGSAESAEDGSWSVPVPGSGDYRIELDENTLPSGVVVATGRPVLELFVRPGSVGNALFPLSTGADAPAPSPTEDTEPGTPVSPPPAGEQPAEEEEEDIGEEPEVIAGPGRFDREVTAVYSGIHFGLIIALAALGLSLIFGTMGLVNFSHGELVSFGALMAVLFNVIGVFGLRLHLAVAALIAVMLGVLFGYLQDRYFWGKLRRRGTSLIVMMIVSIGAALLLRNAYLYLFGGGRRQYDDYAVQQPLSIGPLFVQPKTLITDGIAVVVLLAVTLALMLTRFGKAVRAVADNPALAAASGINVDQVIRLVWGVGAGLAALAGVNLAIHQSASFQMGFQMLLLIFAAVVAGGLGTVFGAVVGALMVGLLVQVSTLWIPSEFKYVAALALLIGVLLVRPQGILGRRERIG